VRGQAQLAADDGTAENRREIGGQRVGHTWTLPLEAIGDREDREGEDEQNGESGSRRHSRASHPS
jgi:hypothetical protein